MSARGFKIEVSDNSGAWYDCLVFGERVSIQAAESMCEAYVNESGWERVRLVDHCNTVQAEWVRETHPVTLARRIIP